MTRNEHIEKIRYSHIIDANVLDAEDMYAMHKRWSNRLDMIRWSIIIDTLNEMDA